MQDIEEMKRLSRERMAQTAEALREKLKSIRHKVAVYSAKGGVGKTTVAVNLAVALADKGYAVGFLDADIDCPNSQLFFGIKEKTKIVNGLLQPVKKHDVLVVSMSMLTDKDDEAIMWRGPMLTKAINDLLFLTDWGELDYLIIDLPPGTSDAPLTILQMLDLDGFIAVTTPQQVAVNDMRRAVNMIRNMGTSVLGLVDNMCGDVFGCTKNEAAKIMGTRFLAHIPMDAAVSQAGDDGVPVVLKSPRMMEKFNAIVNAITQ